MYEAMINTLVSTGFIKDLDEIVNENPIEIDHVALSGDTNDYAII